MGRRGVGSWWLRGMAAVVWCAQPGLADVMLDTVHPPGAPSVEVIFMHAPADQGQVWEVFRREISAPGSWALALPLVVLGPGVETPWADGTGTPAVCAYLASRAHLDQDGDGLSDGRELVLYQTDPTEADTDGDGADDGLEVAQGRNPVAGLVPPATVGLVLHVHTPHGD